ncbi:MAG: class C sortase [Ruminococcus sp.]|jgi:LPXTG-site transpeptidase (sortase) family protein
MMKRILLYLIVAVIFAAGFLLVFYPIGRSAAAEHKNRASIRHFREITENCGESMDKVISETGKASSDSSDSPEGSSSGGTMAYAQLFSEMEAYNRRIYQENQESLCDAWSYQQNVFDFPSTGLEDDMVGYITIDAMNVELPLYIGANEENMSKGAVVLSQTSMPIGGENTNCVIAAHRGWYTSPMFQDIEVLQPGDEVRVTNLWGTLTYQVVKTIVIEPTDIDAVKIIEGEDLLTLVTCHPYTQNYQRYVVYCSRTGGSNRNLSEKEQEEAKEEESLQAESPAEVNIPFEGIPWESSEPAIRRERQVNRIAVLGVGLVFILLLAGLIIRSLKKKRKN